MSTTVGRFQPQTRRQIEFDRPADMLTWFRDHPDDAADIDRYVWTTQKISGGH